MIGRPRSETARRSILEAALRLCERDGYANVTLKGIAEEAGTGRQTLYRWWQTKGEVFLEAVTDLAARELDPSPETLEEFLADAFVLTNGVVGQVIVGLMAEAQSDPGLATRLRAGLIGPRREALQEMLERGGGVPAGVDPGTLVDMIFGAMWYRLLNRHAPVDAALAGEITRLVARIT
ncbi:TetR/AcrR family transcriptional regulator [Microbispora sp. RL4-1S]|uniref:TetR/AcrR family transcriptional regulator n=1 Tax=Microbispora oryzae TaxID=2806554 RepID=A0A941ART4_9ACTN|nr:TetR/AcrR family transcriptional regulator [Microbispora oryzae]MBP2706634.1 TetR/AcrR family transcriptional regulator [Microbispora oryzae]